MKKPFIALILTVLSACVVVPIPVGRAVGPVSSVPVQATDSFTNDLNAFRASQGMGPMRQNATLTRAAQLHAKDMVTRGYFSHRSPGGPNGDDLMDRARASGCGARAAAENIANGQRTSAAVLQAWAESPGHRSNMLRRNYTDYGLGREGNIWVLLVSTSC